MTVVAFPLGNAEVDVSCKGTKVRPGDPDLSCDRSSFRRLWGGPSGSGFLPFQNVCYNNKDREERLQLKTYFFRRYLCSRCTHNLQATLYRSDSS